MQKEKLVKYNAIVNPNVICGNGIGYWIPRECEHVT